MVAILVVFAAFLAQAPVFSLAQTSSPPGVAQCVPGVDPWSFNSLSQSPCEVAVDLAGVCESGFGIPPLPPDNKYRGPQVQGDNNTCICNTVYFSLLNACASCQNRNTTSWSVYKTNCSTVYLSIFPDPIPSNTRVPNYAYLDVVGPDGLNITLAQSAGGVESTSVPSQTSSPLPTSSSPASTSHSHNHAGAIAGGVVGGVAGIILLAFVCSVIYRQRKSRPTGVYDPPLAAEMDAASGYPDSQFKLYNPDDRSTHPPPLMGQTLMGQRPTTPQPVQPLYTGRAEV